MTRPHETDRDCATEFRIGHCGAGKDQNCDCEACLAWHLGISYPFPLVTEEDIYGSDP